MGLYCMALVAEIAQAPSTSGPPFCWPALRDGAVQTKYAGRLLSGAEAGTEVREEATYGSVERAVQMNFEEKGTGLTVLSRVEA